ncbi:MAG: secretin N-terminal domain-containing protein, partial [Pseudomonadota bacterium]|nr:secretin N-terminal domain-containing protein [Pseudomonadota bacterium]
MIKLFGGVGLLLLLSACGLQVVKPDQSASAAIQKALTVKKHSKPESAAVPKEVSQALLPPLNIQMPLPSAKPLNPRFDLNVHDAPAAEVFMGIVSGTQYSMLVHPDVKGHITVNLKDVTLFQALDAISNLYGYDYRVDGNQIFIEPPTMQTRVFHVNYIPGDRKGLSLTRVSSSEIQPGTMNSNYGQPNANMPYSPTNSSSTAQDTESSSVETTVNSNFWGELTASLKTIVGTGGGRSVVINPQSGVIVARAMPKQLDNIAAFLKATQLSVDRQVILDAKIIEVDLNKQFQAGINWAALGGANGQRRYSIGELDQGSVLQGKSLTGGLSDPTTSLSSLPGQTLSSGSNAIGGMFGVALQTGNLSALISFLQTQGTVHVLSSPRIATVNNQKAILKVGTDEFFPVGFTNSLATSVTGTTSAPSVELEPFFSGIALDVTPEIDAKGAIILHIHPSVSNVTQVNKQIEFGSNQVINLPLASSDISETDSIVRAHNGEIIVLGGLMKESVVDNNSKVPVLGDMPL